MIGIFGGMGPLAGLRFSTLLTELNSVEKEQDHLKFILYNNPSIPDRTSAILSNDTDKILNGLYTGVETLIRAGATCIVITCNTAHYFLDVLIKKYKNIEFLDIIQLTADYININFGTISVGLISTSGTVLTGLYQRYFKNLIIPDKIQQNKIMSAIHNIKLGNHPAAKTVLLESKRDLIDSGAEIIVLGCTELPLIIELNSKTLDPLLITAQAIISQESK